MFIRPEVLADNGEKDDREFSFISSFWPMGFCNRNVVSQMIYARENSKVFFILPTLAIGYDLDETFFIELGWLNYVVGYGQ
jgi:hypothetical protein